MIWYATLKEYIAVFLSFEDFPPNIECGVGNKSKKKKCSAENIVLCLKK